MIQLMVGKKGSGKTKTLIHLVNEAVRVSDGMVVCVEKGLKLTYDLSHRARLIDSDEYKINGYEAFYGFLSGILACNYDIKEVFIDQTLKIGGEDYVALARMIEKLEALIAREPITILFTISCDPEQLPESLHGKIVTAEELLRA